MIDVDASEMFFLRMLCRRLDMPALETRVVWATWGQEAILKIAPPLSSEGKVLSS